jgi:2'-5' RNA ligase
MRLFIAINLPQEIKDKIEEAVIKIQLLFNFPVRFLTPKNWHLTITFLGYQPDKAVSLILKSVQETAAGFGPVLIKFEKIIYGPPGKPARMLWLAGAEETSRNLGEIKNKLEDSLVENGVKFNRENRLFNAHLTLARFSNPLTKLSDDLIAPLSLSFEAKTLDLMESRLKRSGAEYETISQFAFGPSVL